MSTEPDTEIQIVSHSHVPLYVDRQTMSGARIRVNINSPQCEDLGHEWRDSMEFYPSYSRRVTHTVRCIKCNMEVVYNSFNMARSSNDRVNYPSPKGKGLQDS
jgi:hypothetical protein